MVPGVHLENCVIKHLNAFDNIQSFFGKHLWKKMITLRFIYFAFNAKKDALKLLEIWKKLQILEIEILL